MISRAVNDRDRGLGEVEIKVEHAAIEYLAKVCDGDGRRALSILETAVLSSEAPVHLTEALMRDASSHRAIQYDPTGDEHYDCASALIKSIRGSDPDAAVYWLARMLAGGEEIRFLCRRLIILASEDIGNADPHALPLTVACSAACEQIGLPECQLTLSQTVTYLACAPKSNSATVAIGKAKSDIQNGRVLPVPKHLRDGHYGGAKELGHGKGYKSSHKHPNGYVKQDYLGVEATYYEPTDRGHEKTMQEYLNHIRKCEDR
jgi:putative ATPase